MVADSKKIENVGKCHKVKLQMQEYNLESDFFAVPLGGVDVVLRIQWLQTLGVYFDNHQVQMARKKVQIVWFPTTPNSIGYITSDGKANSKRSTCLRNSMSRDGVANM